MTIRLLAALFVLTLAVPSFAQDPPAYDVSGSYSFLRDRTIEENLHGWLAGFTGHVTPLLAIAGEVGGNYGSVSEIDFSSHSFMVGPRLSARPSPTVTPFFHVLFGAERFSLLDESFTNFALQPGGGVDFFTTPTFAFRVGADYRRIFMDDDGRNQFRFTVGVVLTGGAR